MVTMPSIPGELAFAWAITNGRNDLPIKVGLRTILSFRLARYFEFDVCLNRSLATGLL